MNPRASAAARRGRRWPPRCAPAACSAQRAGRRPASSASPPPTAASTPSPTSPPRARCSAPRQLDALDRGALRDAAARRRALRGQEPVRHRRACRTLAGSKIERDARAGGARRGAGAAPRSRRRGAGRRAQHGRVRLRLHHRELARRADAQSARPVAHRRRLLGRLGRGGRGRPGAADAGLGHQRLDPRASLAVRRRSGSSPPSAGCRAPAATRSSPASTTSVRSPARVARPGARLRRDAGPRRRRCRLRAARRVEPVLPRLGARRRGPARRRARRLLPRQATPPARAAVQRVAAGARRRAGRSSCRWPRPGAPPPS